MKAKSIIRNVITIALWVAIAAAMIMVLVAAIKSNRQTACSGIKIEINNTGGENTFLTNGDIVKIMKTSFGGQIVGNAKVAIPVDAIEKRLARAQWVKSAELFFDKQNMLHVQIEEVVPVARVFTASGKTYCLSNEKTIIPIAQHMVFNVPVFTNVPDEIEDKKADSLFKEDLAEVSTFILADTLWSSLISQIVVSPSPYYKHRYEMMLIPIVGNQRISIGTGDDIEKKFGRLLMFYQNVLAKTGFEKYANIDVRYRGQVVTSDKVKSVQAMVSRPVASSIKNTKPVAAKKAETKKQVKQDKPATKSNKVEKKANIKKASINQEVLKPKAVMPSIKKSGNN